MSGEPKGLRWIATSALPIDLLAHAARHAATETRADKAARTWRAPSWVRAGVAFVGMWGACAAVFSVDPLAFSSPWRWLPLVAGAVDLVTVCASTSPTFWEVGVQVAG